MRYNIFLSGLQWSGVVAVALALFAPTAAQGQDLSLSYAVAAGSTGPDAGAGVAVDMVGSTYSTGHFTVTADFDPGPGTFNLTSSGRLEIFIWKLDVSGNLVWAKAIGAGGDDVGNALALDALGNVYITGRFDRTVDFDPGAGTANLTSAGSADIFVLKLDTNGNFLWAVVMGGTLVDAGLGIGVDAAGNVYTAGGFSGTVDFDPGAGTFNLTSAGLGDTFISKLDTNGNFLWAKAVGGAGAVTSGRGMALDASGNVYATGNFQGTSDFDPGAGTFNLTSAGGNDIFILKLDASGNFLWAKAAGSALGDFGFGVTADASGNVYTTGVFEGTADFDPGAGTFNLTSAGGRDMFVLKLDASGNFLWAMAAGNASPTLEDRGTSITLDTSGNVFTAGRFGGTVDFDPGPGTANRTSLGNIDAFILKLDPSGNFVLAEVVVIGTAPNGASDIAVDSSGNVYTTGSFQGTADFDPGAGTANLTSAGINDIFVLKLADLTNTPPVAGAGADQTLQRTGPGGALVSLDGSGSTDADSTPGTNDDIALFQWLLGGSVIAVGELAQATLPLGTHTVTLLVTDSFGATDEDKVQITIQDTTAPVLTIPPDVTAEFTSSTGTPVDIGLATATDASGTVTISNNAPVLFDLGSTVVIWTATDSNGNVSTTNQTVTVVDTTPPVLSGVPLDVTVQCSSVPGVAAVTASDTNDPNPALVFSETRTDGSSPDNYTLTRTWTTTDSFGNVSSRTQIITVQDSSEPILIGVPLNITVECDAVPAPASPAASDTCDPAPTISFSEVRTDGSSLDNYTLARTWTATDQSGNSSSQTQIVTVQDTTAPVITSPGNQTVVPAACDFVVVFTGATATDNCDPNVIVVTTPPSSSVLGVGVHTISITATDRTGNSTSTSFTVTVLQPLQVIFEQPPLRDDNVRDDIETDADVVNRFRAGQTIPVKVKVLDCNGVDVTKSIAPLVTMRVDATERAGTGTSSVVVNDVPEDFNGVGDPETTMVLIGNHFQYNLITADFDMGTLSDPNRFFRVHVTVEFNSDPGLVVGEEDALLESK